MLFEQPAMHRRYWHTCEGAERLAEEKRVLVLWSKLCAVTPAWLLQHGPEALLRKALQHHRTHGIQAILWVREMTSLRSLMTLKSLGASARDIRVEALAPLWPSMEEGMTEDLLDHISTEDARIGADLHEAWETIFQSIAFVMGPRRRKLLQERRQLLLGWLVRRRKVLRALQRHLEVAEGVLFFEE